MSDPEAQLEIERKYLLDRVPEMPERMQVVRIEQGYLPAGPGDGPVGRVRRSTLEDGRVICRHTVKRGTGLVREEIERELSDDEFAALWPRTAGRRLTKTRYMSRIGALVWVVDVLDRLDLVLAEVELPTPETAAEPPPWLAAVIVREVTDDPAYTNANLARLIAERSEA